MLIKNRHGNEHRCVPCSCSCGWSVSSQRPLWGKHNWSKPCWAWILELKVVKRVGARPCKHSGINTYVSTWGGQILSALPCLCGWFPGTMLCCSNLSNYDCFGETSEPVRKQVMGHGLKPGFHFQRFEIYFSFHLKGPESSPHSFSPWRYQLSALCAPRKAAPHCWRVVSSDVRKDCGNVCVERQSWVWMFCFVLFFSIKR
jgi:hypothetical protein